MYRSRVLTAAIGAGAIATSLALALATPATAAPGRPAGTPTATKVTGEQLSTAQVAALQDAVKNNPHLTATQAQGVISAAGAAAGQVSPDGHGSAPGPCGNASLFGYSNGGYGLALFFNATVGPPVVGNVAISTNGIFPSTDYRGIPPTSFSGTLSDTGAIPDATTANGWAVTSNAWYCGIAVTAYW